MEENKHFTTITKKELNDDEMSLIAYANKSNVIDRSGDVIADDAWILDSFIQNAVICAFHQYDRPPVAKALWVKVVPGQGLRMKIKFASTDEGKEFYQLYKEGVLNAFSVGFRGLEYKERDEFNQKDIEKYTIDGKLPSCVFTKVELFEVSAVAVPDNQAALVERHANGEFKTKGVESFYIESIKDFNLDDIKLENETIDIEEKEIDIVDEIGVKDIPDEIQLEEKEVIEDIEKEIDSKQEEKMNESESENEESKEVDDIEEKEVELEEEFNIKDLIEQINELKKEIADIKSEVNHQEEIGMPAESIDFKSMFDDLKSHFDESIKAKQTKEEPEIQSIEIDPEQLVGLVKQAILDVQKKDEIDLSQITIDALKKAKGQLF